MKKGIMALGIFLLSLILTCPVQAAIEWDPVLVSTKYDINYQGGTFVYLGFGGSPQYLTANQHLTLPSPQTLNEYFGSYPGSATLYAETHGGILPMGSQIQAYSDITYTDGVTPNHFNANENGMNVRQEISSHIVRAFTNTGSAPITVDLVAEFTGMINFSSFNFNYDYYYDNDPTTDPFESNDTYAYYLLSGTVTITEQVQTQIENTYTITLDNNTWSDTLEVIVNPLSEGYDYTLSTALYIQTFVKNWTVSGSAFQGFPLDGAFTIGDTNNPFTLTATVPVPPSLVLLLSGLGGLAFTRRRFSNGRW